MCPHICLQQVLQQVHHVPCTINAQALAAAWRTRGASLGSLIVYWYYLIDIDSILRYRLNFIEHIINKDLDDRPKMIWLACA